MATVDQPSPLLALTLMGDGTHTDTWGEVLNANQLVIENSIAGVGTVSGLTGGTYTVDATTALNAVLVFKGALLANQAIVVPSLQHVWMLDNQTTGPFTLTVKAGGGAGVKVSQGLVNQAYCDGAAVRSVSIPGVPVGVVEEFYGLSLPDPSWLWANGGTANRTTYSLLFSFLTTTAQITPVAGAKTIACSTDLTALGLVGAAIEAKFLGDGTKVTAVTATQITLSKAVSGNADGTSQAAIFFPYGNGNGSTNFTLPDKRGKVSAGIGTMGGTADPGVISAATVAGGLMLGATIGEDQHKLTAAEIAAHTHPTNDPGHNHTLNDPGHKHTLNRPNQNSAVNSGSNLNAANGDFQNSTDTAVTGISLASATTGITVSANTGGDGAHNNMQPTIGCNFIIKATL